MCNPVEELFSRPIPERVWHYTSLEGFEGILTSGNVWATDARFTNDSTEFIHARDVAETCIQSLNAAGILGNFPSLDLQEMLHHAFDRGALSPLENEVYLISFSEARDLLTQWTQYADRGRGVSIGFDLRYIRPPRELEVAVTFAPCIYQQNEKQQLVQSAFTEFTSSVTLLESKSKSENWLKEQLRTWKIIDRVFGLAFDRAKFEEINALKFKGQLLKAWRRTLFDLLRVASHCKDAAFFAEQEWRLAMPRPKGRPSTENPVKFRGRSGNIPYFESSLFSDGPLPIVEIMTGPLCSEVARIHDVMDRTGYTSPITGSNAPLRDPGML